MQCDRATFKAITFSDSKFVEVSNLTRYATHTCKQTTYLRFLMAVVPTQQPTHNENEHESCEVKLELKGHTAKVLTTKKPSVKLKIGLLLLFLT